jgi:glycosyltransferase involved in cell wall biosynthesis
MLVLHRALKTWQHKVDGYIALTEFAREKFVEGGIPGEKISVKPNFLYPDPGPRAAGEGYALFVGRLSPEKGILTLMRAWRSLPNIPLQIVGDGPLMGEVLSKARELNRPDVECVGWLSRNEVLEKLKGANFVVVPSNCNEGFPLTIVEALACGVPIVGSRLGGINEILRSGESGLLFEPEDADDLSEVAQRLWLNELLQRRLGDNARSQFEEKFTANRNYEILMGIIDGVCYRRRAADARLI